MIQNFFAKIWVLLLFSKKYAQSKHLPNDKKSPNLVTLLTIVEVGRNAGRMSNESRITSAKRQFTSAKLFRGITPRNDKVFYCCTIVVHPTAAECVFTPFRTLLTM
jgi:hypothetical protein